MRNVSAKSPVRRIPATVVRRLADLYSRNGYVRWQNERRLAEEGYQVYKKGVELRLVADSLEELAAIRKLLERAAFRPGKAFVKARQYRQPVYGKRAVARFLELIGQTVFLE